MNLNTHWKHPQKQIATMPTIRYRESKFWPLAVLFTIGAVWRAARAKYGWLAATLMILPGIPLVASMAYTQPSSRATGFLVTAAIWNQDAVDNVIFLHDRKVRILMNGSQGDNDALQNTTRKQRISGAFAQIFSFIVPDDWDSTDKLAWVYSPATTGTSDVDIFVNYGKLSTNEAEDTHQGSVVAGGEAVTQDQLYELDITGAIGSLAAGDVVSMHIEAGGAGPTLYDLGLLWAFARI